MKPARSKNSKRTAFRRFVSEGHGATAVEFALVGPVFVALLLAILETALVFFAQQVLQTATLQAARQIMTGQAQAANMTQTQFEALVCANANGLFNCSKLYASAQTFTSFTGATTYNPVSGSGTFNSSNIPFATGGAGDVELVQVYYQWPVWPGPLSFTLANASGNTDVLVGTAAFRVEP